MSGGYNFGSFSGNQSVNLNMIMSGKYNSGGLFTLIIAVCVICAMTERSRP